MTENKTGDCQYYEPELSDEMAIECLQSIILMGNQALAKKAAIRALQERIGQREAQHG